MTSAQSTISAMKHLVELTDCKYQSQNFVIYLSIVTFNFCVFRTQEVLSFLSHLGICGAVLPVQRALDGLAIVVSR